MIKVQLQKIYKNIKSFLNYFTHTPYSHSLMEICSGVCWGSILPTADKFKLKNYHLNKWVAKLFSLSSFYLRLSPSKMINSVPSLIFGLLRAGHVWSA